MRCANPVFVIQSFYKACLFSIFNQKKNPEYMFQLQNESSVARRRKYKKKIQVISCVAMHKDSKKRWQSKGFSLNGSFLPVSWHSERCPALFWHHTREKTQFCWHQDNSLQYILYIFCRCSEETPLVVMLFFFNLGRKINLTTNRAQKHFNFLRKTGVDLEMW